MTRLRGLTMLIVGALAAGHLVSAQAPQAPAPRPRTGLVVGRVIDAVTRAPIAGAIVSLMRSEGESLVELAVATGTDGQFMFAGLPAGRFRLGVQRSGYAPGAAGQTRPSPHQDAGAFELKENERRGDVVLRLWKYSAISGRVVDDAGEPVIGIRVSAFRRTFIAGRPAIDMHGTDALTDDRGTYRVHRLLPGDYVVGIIRDSRATPVSAVEAAAAEREKEASADRRMTSEIGSGDASLPGSFRALRVGDSYQSIGSPPPVVTAAGILIYPSTFYPGTTDAAEARTVTIGASEIGGIDFAMRPIRATSVTGTIVDSGSSIAHLTVRLISANPGDATEELGPELSTATDARGRYMFPAVPPGSYTVRVFQGQPASSEASVIELSGDTAGAVVTAFEAAPPPTTKMPTRFANAAVTVGDRPVTVPPLTMSRGVKVTGRIVFSGGGKPPDEEALQQMVVRFEPANARALGPDFEALATVDARASFESLELPPGLYLVHVEPVEGWTLGSVMAGTRDVSVMPLEIRDAPVAGVEIRLIDRPSTLTGSIVGDVPAGESGSPLVVIFPVDRAGWVDFGFTPRRLIERIAGETGGFQVSGLPPGDYFAAAILSDGLRDWRTPDVLERLAREATRVRVVQGQQASVTLRVSR